MDFDKEDKVINFIISKLKYGEYTIINQRDLKPDYDFETPNELNNIFKLAEEYGLLDRKGKRTIVWLTAKGYEVQKKGGWLKAIEDENIKLQKETERQIKSDQILDLELTLKKFESKVGRKIMIGGFIVTTLSFLITLLTIKFYSTEKQPQKIEKTEK